RALSEPPKNFDLNRKIARLLGEKRKAIDSGKDIDWATGEALAWGTLLAEGTPVRLSGQDSGRGTFSQRHSVLVDQSNDAGYVQLSAEDNWQVIVPTTPANYFHALRRQVRRAFRKPLIVMTPKSLLRHKECVSTLADMGPGSSFRRILVETDQLADAAKVRRVILCSGKVYFDLVAERRKRRIGDIAILRIEQLYPFPIKRLGTRLSQYPNAEVVWCQEEPENMGAWHFVDRRIDKALGAIDVKAKRPTYIGRPESASPATGSARTHLKEQADLVDRALTVG